MVFSRVFVLFVLLLSFLANGQQSIDATSKVSFKIKNAGIEVDGQMSGLKGSASFDLNHIELSKFAITLETNTINTGINARDNHLKKEEYFDVAKYPQILFQSTKVFSENGKYWVEGNLSIKGKVKNIKFPFTVKQENSKLILNASVGLNRRDFNVGGKSWILADDLVVLVNLVLK